MASIGKITDLKINGSSSYSGKGPVTLTWTKPTISGTFSNGQYISIDIDDGDSWGESGTPSIDSGPTSYTFTQSDIDHVKNSGNVATITVIYFGYDSNWNFITGSSNVVTFTYQEFKTLFYATGGKWVECMPYYGAGGKWVQCEPYYGTGGKWVACSGG